MAENITEDSLRNQGFSEKEISRLNEVLARPESKDESYLSLLQDLRKRFFGGCFCILLLLTFVLPPMFRRTDITSITTYAGVIIFALLVVYIVTPMNLGWKAYRFTQRFFS